MSDFTEQDIEAIYRVVALRRDMRHFLPDPLDEELLERLLNAAHLAPSVGFMQPWRFIRIRDRDLRSRIYDLVETERQETARALGSRGDEFMRLKVEGIRECGELLVVALTDQRERHVFGRRTMPEMDLASVACAIQNLWLVARAENVGMGWVSMFDPEGLRQLLRMPEGSRPIAVLCLGRVPAFYRQPMLEETQWARRIDLKELVKTDYWSPSPALEPPSGASSGHVATDSRLAADSGCVLGPGYATGSGCTGPAPGCTGPDRTGPLAAPAGTIEG